MKIFGSKLTGILTGILVSLIICSFASARSNPSYTLYKNTLNQGIVVYPSATPQSKLVDFVTKLDFKEVDSGQTVMRFGTNRENLALMMPENVQNKHEIKKFILIQQLNADEYMVGVYDPEWGLTLPGPIFGLAELMANIPKTLNVFNNVKDGIKT
jgi:hypothetical protein